MKIVRVSLIVIGALLALIGLVWIGQGSGYFPYPASSFMIDQRPWMLRGALVAVVGLVVIFAARRFAR
ncbi:membrane protein [Agrobacterium tumefaciens]|uniref:Membrane protein n=1 Tax=Agrobacterium tumefaciens TaxID=358 RepID=A0A0D0J834_AGRTU|nr:membrane protein [Agrobacterium tumefaciens]